MINSKEEKLNLLREIKKEEDIDKEVIREMAQAGLINNPEDWFGFLEARNLSSHSYDEEVAKKIENIFNNFFTEAESLVDLLLKNPSSDLNRH